MPSTAPAQEQGFCIRQTCIDWFSPHSVDILFVVEKKLVTSYIAFKIAD